MRQSEQDRKALAAIEKHGAMLVYPIANRADVPSLWSALYPRSQMRWAWDDASDPRVGEVWQLRMRLAEGRQVVYAKWYQGRAAFFSRELFAAMLATLTARRPELSREARELLALLEDDSPQSTKILRRAAGLRGRESERVWLRSLKELWDQLLIVGTGEVADGSFPSLEVGATRWIFEPLWEAASTPPSARQQQLLEQQLAPDSAFGKHWNKQLQTWTMRPSMP